MDWQAQEPRVGHDAAEADTRQIADRLRRESSAATSRLHEQIELLEVVAALQTGEVTLNPLCVIQPRGTALALTGEIDLHNAEEIEARLLAWLCDTDNHLDCTGVDYMDSTGLSMILRVHAAAARRGAHLRITCSPNMHLVLSMAGLVESLPGLTVARAESG